MTPYLLLRAADSTWLEFVAPRQVFCCDNQHDVYPTLAEVEAAVYQTGLWAAGFVSYEAAAGFDPNLVVNHDSGFPFLWFGLFSAPRGHNRLVYCGLSQDPKVRWQNGITWPDYRRSLSAIKEYIARGDTYQVNFSYRLHSSDTANPRDFFQAINGLSPAPYAAYLDLPDWSVCCASPELFMRRHGSWVESRPMKGTAPRGLTWESDQQMRQALQNSAKDRAENLMIVDMVRNDLGKIASTGTVSVPELFKVEKHATVWQMTSLVRAKTQSGLADIFSALFPAASITGAPKRRTMEIIHELEDAPRRIYTGAIGYLKPSGDARFNVAIRCALLDKANQRWEYGVGGGITWDSDPCSEWAECENKTRVLKSYSGGDFELLETLLWTPLEGYVLLEYHLQRLFRSADYFDFAYDPGLLGQTLTQRASSFVSSPQRVRVTVNPAGNIEVEAKALTEGWQSFADLVTAIEPVDSADPFLYHKTTQRQVYQQRERQLPPVCEVLLHNQRGEVTETSRANIAARVDGQLVTPPVECGLLAGTYRAWLLEQGELKEKVITLQQLSEATEIFLMNSVRGFHPVRWRKETG